jgi:hypothetical protein
MTNMPASTDFHCFTNTRSAFALNGLEVSKDRGLSGVRILIYKIYTRLKQIKASQAESCSELSPVSPGIDTHRAAT